MNTFVQLPKFPPHVPTCTDIGVAFPAVMVGAGKVVKSEYSFNIEAPVPVVAQVDVLFNDPNVTFKISSSAVLVALDDK